MIRVRAVCPPDLTERAMALLGAEPCVLNLHHQPGRVRNPDGDAIQCDVLTGAANEVLRGLRELGLEQRGSIVLDPVDTVFSDRATRTWAKELGARPRAPVWEQVEARIRAEGRYPPSFYLFLVIAGLIGAVGIITNSQILIVAAMVVGPEYGAITSVALGIDNRSRPRVEQGLLALLVGFVLAVVATFLFALLVRGFDFQPEAFERGVRPVSNLINTPNFFSAVVAVLAGVVGIVSLTEARTSALLGVFISVTTIPAGADIGVSVAFASWDEARGSLLQLLLNIVVLIVVGTLTLKCQRAIWRRVSERRHRRPARRTV
ncbi:putative hydrophobic protein (TIGR00271 family) [Streptomyces sp. 3330]|nr:putative hydrophobic protein (TIGR00271 family) [Streptomyces sp. 3330]